MPKQDPREQLFRKYSVNLQMYHPDAGEVFVCPICFDGYNHDALTSGELTSDHIIPSTIGGRVRTLTCKSCNNKRGGSDVESHLVRRLRAEDKMAGKSDSPIRSRIKIGEGEFAADVYMSDKGVYIEGISKISNPKLQTLAMNGFGSSSPKFEISANLMYKEIPSRVAILRIAYLVMFHYFGYGYIRYKHLDNVRNQILDPNSETSVMKGLLTFKSKPLTKAMVAIVIEPKELQCFLVVLDLSTKTERYLGVVLPGFDDQNETIYDRWANLGVEGLRKLVSNNKIIPYSVEYTTNPLYKFLPHRIWREYLQKVP